MFLHKSEAMVEDKHISQPLILIECIGSVLKGLELFSIDVAPKMIAHMCTLFRKVLESCPRSLP
jgi:hypothetical protein